MYAWIGTRLKSPRPGANESGTSSGRHRRGDDEEHFVFGRTIRATTVIDVEEHSSNGESMSIDRGVSGFGQDGAPVRMQEIELSMATNKTICGRAWS